MAVVKEKSVKKDAAERSSSSSFWLNLLVVGLYKRNQGRITRQVTFFSIAVGLVIGAWRMNEMAAPDEPLMRLVLPALIVVVGLWVAYRLVNMANFADFLIAVEAEMGKVSWPTRTELIRGTVVVLLTIIVLAAVLFFFDLFWQFVFQNLLHILG